MAKITLQFQNGKGIKSLSDTVMDFENVHRSMIQDVVEQSSPDATGWMKNNAPWTDRTGNARAGLFTTMHSDAEVIDLVFAHSVWYGVFLELANSGKYGIITQAIQFWGDEIMSRIRDTFNHLEGMPS